jgi:hypothetical protein
MTAERSAALAETWRQTLAGLPTQLARLIYLASLRNLNTGRYEHYGLAQRIGDEESDRLIRQSHLDVFADWLGYSLAGQRSELEEYFAGLEGDRKEVVRNWLAIEPYMAWVPADSRENERQLFLSDLKTVVELIRGASGVSAPDRE